MERIGVQAPGGAETPISMLHRTLPRGEETPSAFRARRAGPQLLPPANCLATGPSRCMTEVGNANESPRAATARMIARFTRCFSPMPSWKSGAFVA